jgi:AraC-like DNA-binding protein
MDRLPRYSDWLHLSSRLLWCYDDVVSRRATPPGQQVVPLYAHNSAWLVHTGQAEVTDADGTIVRAGAGEWLIAQPGRRDQRFTPGTRMLSLAFDVRWPDGAPWLAAGLSTVLPAGTAPQLARRARPMVRLMNRLAPDTWDARDHRLGHRDFLRLQSALLLFVTELVDVLAQRGILPDYRDPPDERVAAARRRLLAWPLAQPLRVEDIAAAVGLSPVHLRRLFRQQFGTTLKGYAEQLRLEHAQRRLRMPGVRAKEVADELGFAHQAGFTRWYRGHTGQPPTAIRPPGPASGH